MEAAAISFSIWRQHSCEEGVAVLLPGSGKPHIKGRAKAATLLLLLSGSLASSPLSRRILDPGSSGKGKPGRAFPYTVAGR